MLASIVTDSLKRFREKNYWLVYKKISQNQDPILCKSSVVYTRRSSDARLSDCCCIGLWGVIKADLIIHLFTETLLDFILPVPNDKKSSQVSVEVVKFNTVEKYKQSAGMKVGYVGICGVIVGFNKIRECTFKLCAADSVFHHPQWSAPT